MPEMKVMAHEDESLTGEFNEKILVLKRRYVKVIMDLDAVNCRNKRAPKASICASRRSLCSA